MATSSSSRLKAMRGLMGRLLGRSDAVVEEVPPFQESDVDHEATAQRVAAEQLAQNRSKSSELPAGRQFVVPFEFAAEHFGGRWPKLVNRAKLFAENVLERELGERFAMREDGDDGITFVILDDKLDDEDIERLGLALTEAIHRRLIGGDDVDIPIATEVAEGEVETEPPRPDETVDDVTMAAEILAAASEVADNPISSFDNPPEAAEPEFADGWEFAEGPARTTDAGTSDDLASADPPSVEGAEADLEDALSIPVAGERIEAEGKWAPSDDIVEEEHETPLADDREEAVQGEFRSEEIGEAAVEFAASSDLPVDGLAVPTATDLPASEFEIPIADDRLEVEPEVPISTDREEADAAILVSGVETEEETQTTPLADTRDETELAVPLSEERADVAAEFGATDTRDGDAFDIPTSTDLVEKHAEFGQSETLSEARWDVPLSEDIAAPEQPVFAESETMPGEDLPAVLSQDREEAAMGDFGQSATRAEEPLIVPVSDDRVEAETPEFGASETIAEQTAEFSPSHDRETETPAEFGTSETRREEEFAVPVAADRAEIPQADFGQSETKPEAEHEVPLSEDRRQAAIADFGQSETKAEAVYEVPISEDRAAAETPDFGQSETRVEADYAVPVSHDRNEAPPPDFGRSETREETAPDLIVPISTDRVEPTVRLVEISRPQPAAPPPSARAESELPLDHVRLRYGAWLDTKTDVVTTYLADPCTLRLDGSETPYHYLLGNGPSPERCFMLDCLMLEQAMVQIAQVFAEGGQLIIGLPIAATTLARPKFRAEYFRRLKMVDDGIRKMTRMVAYQLPQTSASQASDLFGWLRSMARPPIVRVPPRTEVLAPLAAHGAYGVSINFGKWASQLGELAFAKRLHRIVEQAHFSNLRVAATNLPNKQAIEIALTLGVDLIEIKILKDFNAIPRRLIKIDRASLLRNS